MFAVCVASPDRSILGVLLCVSSLYKLLSMWILAGNVQPFLWVPELCLDTGGVHDDDVVRFVHRFGLLLTTLF